MLTDRKSRADSTFSVHWTLFTFAYSIPLSQIFIPKPEKAFCNVPSLLLVDVLRPPLDVGNWVVLSHLYTRFLYVVHCRSLLDIVG